jgi:hypothetical protein
LLAWILLPLASATRKPNMYDETIPTPLLHRDTARHPEPVSSSTVVFKAIAAGVIGLCLIGLFLR